jgi:hypothetical protein
LPQPADPAKPQLTDPASSSEAVQVACKDRNTTERAFNKLKTFRAVPALAGETSNDAAGFASCHGPHRRSPLQGFDAELRPGPFPDQTASLLPGLLAATRTGLPPAGDDELTNSKIRCYVTASPPTLLGARKPEARRDCAIGSALSGRTHQPCNREGQRTGALRFGDHRAMALADALCLTVHAVTGLTNRSLRGHVAGLLGTDYTASQMSYDLRRLRLHGLIQRIPGTHTYTVTPDGIRVAIFYTKLHHRLPGPLLAADRPPAPPELRAALATIDHAIAGYVTTARLGKAA